MQFSEDQLKKIREFKWEDDVNYEGEEIDDIAGNQFAVNYFECAEEILKKSLDNLKIEHFEQTTATIPVPLSTHELLVEKYKKYSESSKDLMFRMVQGCVLLLADETYKTLFEEKINKQLYVTDDVQFISEKPNIKVEWINLYDNPSLSVADNIFASEIVIEIGLKFN